MSLWKETLGMCRAYARKSYVGGEFTHNGATYSIPELYAWIHQQGMQPQAIPLELLEDAFEAGSSDEPDDSPEFAEHARGTDLTFPIIVQEDESGDITLVDGRHRYWKAREEGAVTIPAYIITGSLPEVTKLEGGGKVYAKERDARPS